MNFARLVLSSSAAAVRTTVCKQKLSAPRVRSFAVATMKDLDYAVDDNVDPDFSSVKVPYLRDEVRQEMYRSYMKDPVENSFENLSKKYGTSLMRTKAAILLMSTRHAMITADEAQLRSLVAGGKETVEAMPAEGAVDTLKIVPVLDAPQVLRDLYMKHVEDQTVTLSQLLSAHNEAIPEDQSGRRLVMSEDDLKQAFRIMSRHAIRQENMDEWKREMEEDLEECEDWGIDGSVFRESPSEFNTSKAYNFSHHRSRHRFRSFEAAYYPQIVTDDNVKATELALLKKVAFETKAQLEHDMEYYERMYSTKSAVERVEEAKTAAIPDALMYHQPPRPDAPMSRFKLAFQDLSKCAVAKNKTGQMRIPDRSVIRTRRGQLRYATPMEEGQMSWRVRPFGLDQGLASQLLPQNFARLVQPYQDVDGDEQQARQMVVDRREKRKAMLAKAAAK